MKKWQTCLLGVGSICCLAACSAKNMSDEATMKEQTKTEQVSSQTATKGQAVACLLYTSPSPRDRQKSRMPSSA